MGLKQATPLIQGTKPCLIYASCPANLYCAMKRQGILTPTIDAKVYTPFLKFIKHILETEVYPMLEDFEYSYEAWYNHLTESQQREIDGVDKSTLESSEKVYNLFCKRECQIIDDWEAANDLYGEPGGLIGPKNRCISAPNAEYKYVHGPVVYALEHLFKRKFKGYTSGLSFSDKARLYNERRLRGLIHRVDGDGSAFDTTQDTLLKMERMIYQHLVDTGKITHVSEESWRIFTSDDLKMKVTYMTKDDIYYKHMFGMLKVLGRVMSGNMDTSFGNTLRMAMYNRYVWEVILGVDKDSYDLDAQGDDFDVFHDGLISRKQIRVAYYTVWSDGKLNQDGTYVVPEHGLGQILKYLNFGTISDTSFCSTEAFYCPTCQSYKVVRQLERFATLNQWSKTLLSLSDHDQAYFLTSLYQANKLWIGELDIFKQLNEWLNYNTHQPSRIITGLKRKYLPHDRRFDYLKDDEHPIMYRLRSFDPSLFYSLRDRVMNNYSCCNIAFREQVLERRYGLTQSAIDSICDTISNTPKNSAQCCLPDLIEGFKARSNYKADLVDGTDY
jgi:hypothetical protein